MNIKKEPLVTTIIPSYNHAQYILTAINSVINQTYKNWELIIIDDGSTDGTHELLSSLTKDKRITIILNKNNKKQSARLNQAIEMSKGEFIGLLASDDWYSHNKLKLQIEHFANLGDEFGVVYSGGYRYYEDTKQTVEVKTNLQMQRGWILEPLLNKPFFIYPISPLVRKRCFQIYKFDESYLAEGEAIYFKIAMTFKFDFIPQPLVTMREHSYNVGGNIDKMLEDNIRYRQELFEHKNFPQQLYKFKGKILARIYKLKGWEYIRIRKDYVNGKAALFNALKENWQLIFDKRLLIGISLCLIPKKYADKLNVSKNNM